MNAVDMVTVAKLLGHALVETTERYTHLSDQSVSFRTPPTGYRTAFMRLWPVKGAEREGGRDQTDG